MVIVFKSKSPHRCRGRAKRSQQCYEYKVEASGSKGYMVAMSSSHGSGSIEDERSCDLDYEVKSRRDADLGSRLGTWHQNQKVPSRSSLQ
jgi:hypothetical protein